MFVEEKPKPRLWPRFALSPNGKRARFDCAGDIPPEWTLQEPLDDDEPVRRGPGRPRKAA